MPNPVIDINSTAVDDSSSLGVVVSIFFLAVFSIGIVVVSVLLLLDNQKFNQQVSRLNQEKAGIYNENLMLRAENEQLKQAVVDAPEPVFVNATVEQECQNQQISMVRVKFFVPCGWHAYANYDNSVQDSFGYVDPNAILTFEPLDSNGVKVKLILSRYAEELGNYADNPLSAVVDEWDNVEKTLHQSVNQTGTLLYTINDGDLEYYYSQYFLNGDYYLLTLEHNTSGDEQASLLVDTISWI